MSENKKQTSDKQQNGNDFIADVISWLHSFYYIIFFRIIYNKEKKAYYVRRRFITHLILSPIILPFFMLYGIILYLNWVIIYYEHYYPSEKLKLTYKQKIWLISRLHP